MPRTRLTLLLLLLVTLAACTGDRPEALSDEALEAKARGIHERLLTIDTHDDIPPNFATPEVDPGVREGRQVTLPKMREGGLDAAFFIVYVGQTERTLENYAKAKEAAMVKFNAIHRMTDEMYPDQIELAYTADDVERIDESGNLCSARWGRERRCPCNT